MCRGVNLGHIFTVLAFDTKRNREESEMILKMCFAFVRVIDILRFRVEIYRERTRRQITIDDPRDYEL